MQKMNLDGKWELYYYPGNEFQIDEPGQLQAAELKPIAATVPGNVELELIREGKLPQEIFKGFNMDKLKDFELYEWWYQRQFTLPKELKGKKLELLFHGVDCLAEYWLNGVKMGSSDNMFIEHGFDVTEYIHADVPNTISIKIKSALREAHSKPYYPYLRANGALNIAGLWMRKAAHCFGWDIMPRAITAGIWRSVELVSHKPYEIKELYFNTNKITENSVNLGVYYVLDVDPYLVDRMQIRFFGRCKDSTFEVTRKVYFKAGTENIHIPNPKLWMPLGYGDANLYNICCELLLDGEVIDKRSETIGLRIAELIRTPITGIEQPGEFLFKINGVAILCKGTNWVPVDPFHSQDAQKVRKMLDLCIDLGCNMIRCWGGNVYEDHEFFDICDREGIMVWQDFAMACGVYPNEEAFIDAIKQELSAVITKLRNHPSLVLWCGDNECDQNCHKRHGMNPLYNKINRKLLPELVFKYDPYRQYIESSPYYTREVVETGNLDLMPDRHLYGARDDYKSKFFTASPAHFVSETGYMGCPNLSTIKRFIDEEYIWPWQGNAQWIAHGTECYGVNGQRSYRIPLIGEGVKEMFGKYAENIEEFVIASQISQAEAVKFFIEFCRLHKWRRTGILWWNVMDGWPQFSDSIVDYYFGKKLAYYYIRRVQQSVCIMIDEPNDWHIKVIVGNDSNKSEDGEYRIWDADSGETLMEGKFTTTANENRELGKIRISRGDHRLFLIEWTFEGKKYANHYLLGNKPFSLEKYQRWLKQIAELSYGFDVDQIGK